MWCCEWMLHGLRQVERPTSTTTSSLVSVLRWSWGWVESFLRRPWIVNEVVHAIWKHTRIRRLDENVSVFNNSCNKFDFISSPYMKNGLVKSACAITSLYRIRTVRYSNSTIDRSESCSLSLSLSLSKERESERVRCKQYCYPFVVHKAATSTSWTG